MILSESLHPAMSRGGFAYSQMVPLSKAVVEDFPETPEGLWLSQVEVSRNGLEAARLDIGSLAVGLATMNGLDAKTIAEVLDMSAYNEATGCWQPDFGISGDEHVSLLWGIAECEMDRPVLNDPALQQRDKLQICQTLHCLNTRHYDFTPSLSQRFELLEIDPRFYHILPSGQIGTIWGDVLPSLADSIAEFRKLQQRCPPYASESDSPLTANGISKITIDGVTGCWAVRSYYTKPLHVRGWQYDGYGRLTLRTHMVPKGSKIRGAQVLAHRVVWRATGHRFIKDMVLNHLCSFRPCANPLHLEQVSKEQNGFHGAKVQRAIASLAARSN